MDNRITKVWYLEMLSIKEFKPTIIPEEAIVIKQEKPSPNINRFFYLEVGKNWRWKDRLEWSIDDWTKWVNRDGLSTWILIFDNIPAGYFELNKLINGVEIAHFGLLPNFIGKGLGGGFLSVAIKEAWELGKKRVWVHTCSLDHPNALKNYKDN